jgi:putative hydrolase of HD superfamily
MLTLLALSIFEHTNIRLDQLKVLKMLMIHDLADAKIGDIPIFEDSERQKTKVADERQAIAHFAKQLSAQTGDEICSLWEEFEAQQTPEAKFAYALDKLEALMQHNMTGCHTWSDGDFKVATYYREESYEFDDFMRLLKKTIDHQTLVQIEKADLLHKVNPEHVKRYRSNTQSN